MDREKQLEELAELQAEKNTTHQGGAELESEEEKVFAQAMRALNQANVPYVVGAAFARHAYTGIWRHTKDLDLFLKPEDLKRAMDVLERAGFDTTIEFRHWLAKAHKPPYFIDLIFGTGHGQIQIDDHWIERSKPAEVLGVRTRLIGIEEMIALGCFVAERSRSDASEVMHLIRGVQGRVDWERVLELLGSNQELLFWQLILFDIVYPGHSDYLPQDLMDRMYREIRARWKNNLEPPNAFRGALMDPFSYSVDFEDWGYQDRRNLEPLVDEQGGIL
jgi:hypothetical protein